MRICFHTVWPISPNFIGGTERFVIDAAKSLRRYGFDCFVLCSNPERKLTIEGVEVFGSIPEPVRSALNSFRNNAFYAIKKTYYSQSTFTESAEALSKYVERQLESVKFDFVHLNTFSSTLFGFDRLPAAVTIHENPDELDAFWHPGAFDALAEAIQCGFATPPQLMAAPTSYYADCYSSRFARHVHAVPLGLPWTNVAGVLTDRRPERRRPRIIVPSRLALRQKGQDVAVAAIDKLHRAGREIELVLTGASEENRAGADAIRRLIDSASRPDLFFIKRAADMRREIEASHIALSPERYCSFGISVRECAAAGLPLVLSDIPPHRELSPAPQSVYFFPVDDVAACASAVQAAIDGEPVDTREAILFRMENDFDAAMRVYGSKYISSPKMRETGENSA